MYKSYPKQPKVLTEKLAEIDRSYEVETRKQDSVDWKNANDWLLIEQSMAKGKLSTYKLDEIFPVGSVVQIRAIDLDFEKYNDEIKFIKQLVLVIPYTEYLNIYWMITHKLEEIFF